MPRTSRDLLRQLSCRLPRLPGMGRCILALDRLLSTAPPGAPDELLAELNARCRLIVDGRVLEQKFAYYYGEWEGEYLAAVLRHYHSGAFYDVGGSIGLYAVTVGLSCASQGRQLRTIEPLPDNLQRLRRNLELNKLSEETVTVHGIGLSDRPGSFQVALVASGVPGNAKVVASGGTEVQVTTLDHLWEAHGREQVGFIKIDTEGYDALILAGGRALLTECRPNLLVEFNRERMRNLQIPIEPAWSLLTEELGYRCLRIDSRGAEIGVSEPGEYENLLFLAPQGAAAPAAVC